MTTSQGKIDKICPTPPLEWFPKHLESHLSEEHVGEAWLMYRLRAGVGGRHSGAESQGALAREAWRVDGRRAASPQLWEQLGCTFSRRLCALGVVRLADVFGGVLHVGTHDAGTGAEGGAAGGDGGEGGDGDGGGDGGGGGDDGSDGDDGGDGGGGGDGGSDDDHTRCRGLCGGGRWMSWGELKAIYGGGGVAFTQADEREYVRLVRELDGRSRWRGAGALPALSLTATAEWRAKRARDQPEMDGELRMARAWLEREQGGGLPPEAVRAARRGSGGLEFLVREQGALVDAWWAEAMLSERLGLVRREERARLEVEARCARVDPVPRSFSEWLEARGERHVLEMAARASDAGEVSEARCELMRLFFEGHVPAARRAQAGATPIAEVLATREELRHTAPPQQSLFID